MAEGLRVGDVEKKGLTGRLREAVERRLEACGRLSRRRRLVVVCGMARSGTSALAAYVASHPGVVPVVGGALWHRLESDYVRTKPDWKFVDSVLDECFPRMVLFKQPWLEFNDDFFEAAGGAKVLLCVREMNGLFSSWASTEYVGRDCKEKPGEVYMRGMFKAMERMMSGAMKVRQEAMSPGLAAPLGRFLGLDPAGFDPERIRAKWRGKDEKAWLESRAVWRDKP